MRTRRRAQKKIAWALVLATAAYLFVFVPLYRSGMVAVVVLSVLLVSGLAWLLGRWGGISAALLAIPLNGYLIGLAGDPFADVLAAHWPVTVVAIASGLSVGWLREIMDKMDEQTWILAQERAARHRAIASMKTLRGLVPVCSSCKKIRDDQGYWGELESYIQVLSPEVDVTHGLCPTCMSQQYPGLYSDMIGEGQGESVDSMGLMLQELSQHPNLVGHNLWVWMQRRQVDSAALADYLGCHGDALKQLAHLRCPKPGKYRDDDLALIAAATGADPDALRDLVYETEQAPQAQSGAA